jgi:hypothetical protein
LREAILRAFATWRASIHEAAVARLVASAGADRVLDLLFDLDTLTQAFADVRTGLRDGVETAMAAVQRQELPRAAQAAGFNVLAPQVVDGIRTLSDRSINTLTEDARETARTVIERGLREGMGPRVIARELRQVIGLAPNQEQAVRNFRRALEGDPTAGSPLSRQLRDRRFDAQLRGERGVSVRAYLSSSEAAGNAVALQTREFALILKDSTHPRFTQVLEVASREMARRTPRNAILVPIPGNTPGELSANRQLADAIAARVPGARVVEAVDRAVTVESSFLRRRQGLPGLTPAEQAASLRQVAALPKGPVIFIDNVETSGNTIRGAAAALGVEPRALTFARAYLPVAEGGTGTVQASPQLGLSAEQIAKMTEAYRRKFLAWNAETNARTMANNAQKLGQHLTWEEAIARGDVEGERLMKRWAGTLDDRERDEHLAMEDEVVGWNEHFSNGEMVPGESTFNCRCVAIYFTARDPLQARRPGRTGGRAQVLGVAA